MTPQFLLWMIPLLVIELVLKGITLWKSAQRKEKGWFVALLIVNSAGILPLIYLMVHGDTLRGKTL